MFLLSRNLTRVCVPCTKTVIKFSIKALLGLYPDTLAIVVYSCVYHANADIDAGEMLDLM